MMTVTLSKNVQGQFINSLNNLKQSNIHLMGKKSNLSGRAVVMVRKEDHQQGILQQSSPLVEAERKSV